MTAVFVVIRTDGEYSDRYETVLGYFCDEEAAQEFCVEAEREWRDAAALYPEPQYPSGMALLHDDHDTVWPEKIIGKHEMEGGGSVTIVTPDYSSEPTRVPVPDEERERRIAIKQSYYRELTYCRNNRLSTVTLDKEGTPGSSWHYAIAEPLGPSK